MKQVIVKVAPDVHARLKREAKKNFRTIGQHLLAMALQAKPADVSLPVAEPAKP